MPIKIREKRKEKSEKDQKKVQASIAVKKAASKKSGGLRVPLFTIKGKQDGQVSLPKAIFGEKVNKVLMSQAVRVYLANQRRGTASTKTRGEVVGSTRKIYRQKGTGRARHGAITAPIFVGGGIVFGPKPRDFSLAMPKKMKKKALFSALSAKLADNAITVVAGLEKITPKTKVMAKLLKTIDVSNKTLLVIPESIEPVTRAARNIAGVEILPANQLNTYTVLQSKTLLFMQQAIDVMEKAVKKETK